MAQPIKKPANGIAEDLAAIIGITNTLILCGIRGGDNLYIPQKVTPDHLLVRIIGETAFHRLVEEFGDTSFTVPTLAMFGRYQRIRRCATLIAEGRSLPQIAKLTGVTPQQVKNDQRSAEMLGLLPMVLRSRGAIKSDSEVVAQLTLPGV